MNDYVFRIGSLDVITWNARALCCADVSKRKKKINVLNDIAQRAGIVRHSSHKFIILGSSKASKC